MYIDMGERIAGKPDRPRLIIEHPLRDPQISQNIHILARIWKIGFQIVSPCCTYVSTVMRSAFADISVPLLPRDFMYGPIMSPIFCILTRKVLIIMLLYLTCKLLLRAGKCEPRWAQSDYWSPPPPPPGSQIAKDVNVFTYEKLIIHCYSMLHILSPMWWGLHATLVTLDSTYTSPGPPKNGNKIMKNVYQITFILYMLLRG